MNLQLLVQIAEFVLALAFFILIHEIGHFAAARLFKIEVEEFGFGLPFPVAGIKLFEINKTKYTLNWLPLGGFVRIKGEQDPTIPDGLAAANPWKRIVVYLAGPIMNLIAAIIVFSVVYSRFGTPIALTDQVQVFAVAAESPAEMAGIKACDYIVQVNDTPIDSTDKLTEMIQGNLEQPTLIVFTRGAERIEATVTPRRHPPEGQGAIGIQMGNPIKFEPLSPWQAVPQGFRMVYDYAYTLAALPGRYVRGELTAAEGRVSGPVGMFSMYSSVRSGDTPGCTPRALNVWGLFGAITASLGLLNLLPIPALDGGRILFTLIELIFRRRVPTKYENALITVTMLLLIGFMVYVTVIDIINPVQIP